MSLARTAGVRFMLSLKLCIARIVNIEMKTGEGYLLDGCRAWMCELVATGIAEVQKGGKMNEFLEALAKIIEQYGGVVLTLGIVTFVITFILVLLIFVIIMKSLWDEDRKWKK